MPFYLITTEEISQHFRLHRGGRLTPTRRYCSICHPLPRNYRENLLIEVNPPFSRFWTWIATRYTAHRFNNFSIQTFEILADSLQ